MENKNQAGAAPTKDQVLDNAIAELSKLFSNMFTFGAEDKARYDVCYASVFGSGANMSYMSATFFAQFAGEILVGMLASNPFRRFIDRALDEESTRKEPGTYWEPTMQQNRFGLAGKDYTADMQALIGMINDSYTKIASLNEWYGTSDGKKEFELYCLSKKATRNIRRAIVEFPYLVRRYDYDQQFAGEIMEYAGIVAAQIRTTAAENEDA